MSLDVALVLVGIVLTASLVILLAVKDIYEKLPVFFAYEAFTLIAGIPSIIALRFALHEYRYIWMSDYVIDTIFYLCTLIELSKKVLRYNRADHSRKISATFLFVLIALLLWSLTPWICVTGSEWYWNAEMRVLQVSAILQMAGLVTTVLWSSLRKFAWSERELHIITGMGLWTVVEFAVFVMFTHGFLKRQGWYWLYQAVSVSVLVATAYWLHYFWLEPAGTGEHRKKIAAANCESDGGNNAADRVTLPRVSNSRWLRPHLKTAKTTRTL